MIGVVIVNGPQVNLVQALSVACLVVQDRRADLCPLRIRVVFRGMV